MDWCRLQLMATAMALPSPIPARAASVRATPQVDPAGDCLEFLDPFLEVGQLDPRSADRRSAVAVMRILDPLEFLSFGASRRARPQQGAGDDGQSDQGGSATSCRFEHSRMSSLNPAFLNRPVCRATLLSAAMFSSACVERIAVGGDPFQHLDPLAQFSISRRVSGSSEIARLSLPYSSVTMPCLARFHWVTPRGSR